jgi:hypothetical protein
MPEGEACVEPSARRACFGAVCSVPSLPDSTKRYLHLRNIRDRENTNIENYVRPGRAACRVFSCVHLGKKMLPPRKLQNSEQAMQFWISKWQRLRLESAPDCLLSPCYSSDPALFARLLFFSQVQIFRALLARPRCILLLLTGKRTSQPRNRSFALCTGVMGEEGLGFVLAKSLIQ